MGFVGRILRRMHIDAVLLSSLLIICAFGLIVLYSAGGQQVDMVIRQGMRFGVAMLALLFVAQLPPGLLRLWSPWVYLSGVLLLLIVLVSGDIGQGARRWLDLGFIRFQPSEIMKLAMPMMAAWYLHERPLPPDTRHVFVLLAIIIAPTVLIALQPDLGTALLIAASGLFVVLLAGLRLHLIAAMAGMVALGAPALWYFMHDYQRQRVLTFLNPERDPLGAGYHIIQSKIAIGSGGVFGKGWLNGSQSQLEFLPEPDTDFIFAVMGEEFGLLGLLGLLGIYIFIVSRGMFIASQGQDTYSRLLAGSISLTFFVYVFVNAGMVTGLLPVVGVPLPLISYGGTAIVTLMAGFGILMSVHTHRKLLSR
ncbi:MAG: rod shape-determining protein RodA [Gammaproteobacteria bacterium]|nr:rod shape-determining protein RodA [Gammaproteobacteria bacterium]